MRKRSIMIVEDELIVAEDLANWLTSLGYAVGARAASGAEAVQLCEKTRPDLILMDILLPGELDGIQAAEIIRKRFDTPVVYLTASSDETTLARAKVTEPFGYILKPFDERGLYTTIEMALFKHQSEKRLRNSEERFRLVYENAPVAFQSLDADAHILQVNKAWEELFGYTAGEAQGRWFGEFLTQDSVPLFIAAFTQFRASPVTDSITLTIVKHNGIRVPASIKGSSAVNQRGGFELTQCVLESRSPAGEHPADGLPEAIVPSPAGPWLVISPEGFILGATPESERLLESTVDRLCSLRLQDICVSDADAAKVLAQLTGTGTLAARWLRIRRASGETTDAVVSGFLLQGQSVLAGSSCIYIQKA